MRRWQLARPESASRLAGTAASQGDVIPLTAYEWLEAETARLGLEVPRGYIERIVRSLSPDRKIRVAGHVELRVADQLLSAIDRPDAFYDGTVTVVGNPHASSRARAACCGGLLG